MFADDFADNESVKREERQSTKRCYYFSSKTGCRFGNKCRFKHEVLNSNAPPQADTDKVVDVPVSFQVQENAEGNPTKLEVSADTVSDTNIPENTGNQSSGGTLDVSPISAENARETLQQVCYNFSRFGWCRFGKRCRYSHLRKEKRNPTIKKEPVIVQDSPTVENDPCGEQNEPVNDEDIQRDISKHATEISSRNRQKKRPTCRFYLKGSCRSGTRCRFAHDDKPRESRDDHHGNTTQQATEYRSVPHDAHAGPNIRGQRYSGQNVPQRPNTSNQTKARSDLTAEDLQQMRKTECDQLKRRFPKGKLEILTESDDSNQYNVEFIPTDPDWPFDIKTFRLQITIPGSYPMNMFSVALLDDDEALPPTVQRYIEVTIDEWLSEKQTSLEKSDKIELVFRPFLRWLDRKMEDIVTESLRQYQRELTAKAAGFEFIPAKFPAEKRAISPGGNEETEPAVGDQGGENSDSETDQTESDGESGDETSESEENEAKATTQKDFTNVDRKGTEVLLKSLQLKDSTATLLFQKLVIVIQCTRCKNTAEFSTPGGRPNSIPCVKCNSTQILVFRPAMAHHFSAVIGYLDLDGCQPYDLVLQDCVSNVGCMNCSKEMKLEGLVPGQVKQCWCLRCHQKLTIAAESVRFQQLQPSEVILEEGGVHQVKISRINKVIKDPAIQEGKPLPGEGTCKHYKKSFRWLRFPCCGKCYPCDICHDKEGDHEMKFANRMICGFCCKEQPYTVEKPCLACGSQLTKMRTSHWEGGRGCRG